MKQLLQNMKDGQTLIVDIPIPKVRPGCALVRIHSSLVSAGTERMLVEFAEKNLVEKARSRPDLVRQVIDKARREGIIPTIKSALIKLDQPMALGYSSAGIIVEIGNGLQGFNVGDRVACAGGGHAVHAEFNVVPQNLMAKIPDGVKFDTAAFSTLGAIALNGIRLAHLGLGEKVAIIGLGLLGMITAELVKASGCQVLGVDVDSEKVKIARKAGFHAVIRSHAEKNCASISSNQGMDAVLICADTQSDDTVNLAGAISRDRGRVISLGVVGIDLPRKPFYEKELFFQVSRSSGPGRYDVNYEEKGQDYPIGYVRWTEQRNMQAFLELIAEKKISIDHLISHHFSITNAQKAYSLLTNKKRATFTGIILDYPENGNETKNDLFRDSSSVDQRVRKNKVVVGVLGAGNYAQSTFLPIIQKSGVILEAIVSASGISSYHAARKFGFSSISPSEEKVFESNRITTILIMTRHHQHAEQVIKSLDNHKHVYCEKPLVINRDQLLVTQKSIKEHPECIVMVGFNRRFSRFGKQMKSLLAGTSEPIAVNYRVNAGYIPQNHWLQDSNEGGRLIGEACHFIDFLSFLTGQIPLSVSAIGLPDRGKYSSDNFSLSFDYPNGSIATLSYLANGDKSCPKEFVEVFYDSTVLRMNDFRTLEHYENGHRKIYRDYLGQDKGHKAAWASFIQAIQEQSLPPIPYIDIFGVHNAIFAAKEALVSGKKINIT